MTGALEGLRLIQIGAGDAASVCGQLLADHGCDVIVVNGASRESQSGSGKRQLWLDLATTRGASLLKALLRRSDFLLAGGQGQQTFATMPGLIVIHLPEAAAQSPTECRQAATSAALGALMALHHRSRTGQGQIVDVPLRPAPRQREGALSAESLNDLLGIDDNQRAELQRDGILRP